MIQEKDFLYRVPVKNALVTAPGKQVRNPEILVDLEGGEFMHGDILDANSTNKLIDQSVKDAIDNSTENSNYVTKNLLEAETSARTKSDEDLNAKIKAEQTRAEGKEKEISDKLANEVTRATGAENDLRTAIDTKADATALSNYVLTTALNQQIDTLNAAIPTNVSQLTNDSNFITQQDADAKYALVDSLNTVNDSISSLMVGLPKKQNKITVNSVDVTDIETADITRLRTIVIELIDALSTSGIISTSISVAELLLPDTIEH